MQLGDGVLSQPAQHLGIIFSTGKIMSRCHRHSTGSFRGVGWTGVSRIQQPQPFRSKASRSCRVDSRKVTKIRKSTFSISLPSLFSPHHASLSNFWCPLSYWAIPYVMDHTSSTPAHTLLFLHHTRDDLQLTLHPEWQGWLQCPLKPRLSQ